MAMSTEPSCTAVMQASKLMGLISSSMPSSSAKKLASVTSKPTYCSWPLLLVSTNSMGAKSGDMATVSFLLSFLHPTTLSSRAAASRMMIALFIFVSSVLSCCPVVYTH